MNALRLSYIYMLTRHIYESRSSHYCRVCCVATYLTYINSIKATSAFIPKQSIQSRSPLVNIQFAAGLHRKGYDSVTSL